MKYKLLVNGSNLSMVKEFLGNMKDSFDCLSTLDDLADLEKHCQLFQPNGILFFVDRLYSGFIDTVSDFRANPEYKHTAIIFVTKDDVVRELESQGNKSLVDLILLRPISSDNVILRVMSFLDKRPRRVSYDYYDDPQNFPPPPVQSAQSAQPAQPVQPAQPAPAAPVQTPPPAPASAPAAKKQILVVDDDRNVLKMLKTALEQKYEVTSTLNGLIVEKILATKKIDLIVLDYEMPIMTGAEVFRKIKANKDYAKIPVCFLTGVTERKKVEEIMLLRPDSYLVKPLDLELLCTAIENLI